jgi:hypothetical protein
MSETPITPAEQLVRDLDAAKKAHERLDDALRSLRLGRKIEQTRHGIFRWRKGVYGGGWLGRDEPEPLQLGATIENEFYEFLSAKRRAASEQVREIQARLGNVDVNP